MDYLMKNSGREWDKDVINDMFSQRDANLILSIPLSQHASEDKLIWAKEMNGKFSVKSCYKTLVGELFEQDVVSWATLWKLKLPPKIKLFFWQVCSGCIPTYDNLKVKHVNCPTLCQLCKMHEENPKHIFLECPVAMEVWTRSNLQLPPIGLCFSLIGLLPYSTS